MLGCYSISDQHIPVSINAYMLWPIQLSREWNTNQEDAQATSITQAILEVVENYFCPSVFTAGFAAGVAVAAFGPVGAPTGRPTGAPDRLLK